MFKSNTDLMRKPLLLLFLLILPFIPLKAHVGSPDIAIEGNAGPYHLLVSVRPPDAIPGTASVTVFAQNGEGLKIYTQPVYFYSGRNGAPSADPLEAIAGQPGHFTGNVWLMTDGSSSILLSVTGNLGKGEMVVPIVAMSTVQKKLPPLTGYSLAVLGIILFVLMVTLIGVSVGEGITRRGETLPASRKRGKLIAFGVTALLSSLLVYGGNAWWQSSAHKFRKMMFKPMHASYQVTSQKDGANHLTIHIDVSEAQRASTLSYLVPDHGKLVHLYLMRFPGLDAIAHVHPIRIDSATFQTNLPPLPKGKYMTFADIVYNTGFTETLKDTLTIDRDLKDSLHQPDPDDTYATVYPVGVHPAGDAASHGGSAFTMQDGSVMIMDEAPDKAFENGQLVTLKFTVYDEHGQPARLMPYMGMLGHAAIVKQDGSTFIHIHPVGTYSMAAQENLLARMGENVEPYREPDPKSFRDSIDRLVAGLRAMSDSQRNDFLMRQMHMPMNGEDNMNMGSMSGMKMGGHPGATMTMNNGIDFPYTFPQPGDYRIWVQVKRNGRVLTAVFDRIVN